MIVTIKSTNKQYEILSICDFGYIHDLRNLANSSDFAGAAIFQATIQTENGIETIVGIAHKGVLTAELCKIPTVRKDKEIDINAILSLKDTLFSERESRVYMVSKRLKETMTFEDAIECIVNKKYEKIKAENTKENDVFTVNKKPLYKIGDKFALISMGIVLAPIKVTKRVIVADYDNPKNTTFQYDLVADFETLKTLNWDKIDEKHLKDWAHSSAYDIKNTTQYAKYQSYVNRFKDLVNVEVELDVINRTSDSKVLQTTKKAGQKWGCGIVIINNEGKALMGLRCKKEDLSQWCFIGGSIEAGETPAEAATREMKEESNLRPLELEYIDSYEMGGYTDFIFISRKFMGEPKPQEGELAELRWVSLEEAGQLQLFPYTAETLSMVRQYMK